MKTALLVALVAALAGPLAAQREAIAALGERARRLRAMADTAAARDRAAMGALIGGPRDTVHADPLIVFVPVGMAADAADGVQLAATRARAALGDAADVLRGTRLTLAFGIGTVGGGGQIPVIGIPDSASAEDIAEAIMRWVGPLLSTRGGAALRAWTVVPVNVDRTDVFAFAHVDLVTATPGASTRCLAGALSDCAVALGLVVPDDPATAYWNAVGRREMVARNHWAYSETALRRLAAPCLAEGDDGACIAYLRHWIAAMPINETPALAPIGTASRQALLLTALAMGGPGALRRLLDDSTRGAVASIEAAAGVPLDAVLAQWQAEVRQARPSAVVGGISRAMALIWTLLFAAMALGGTRWRTG